MTVPATVVLADDHPLMLKALNDLLSDERDFTVLAQCTNGDDALRAVRAHRPDILVLDLRMPGTDGLSVMKAMKAENLATRVVLLAASVEDEETLQATRLGVRGVVLKEMAPRLLVACVRKVHAGGEWLEKQSVSRALEKLLPREAGTREVARLLTAREVEIVRMVSEGLHNKQIAEKLSIGEGTVKVHLHNIYEKLGVDGRVALTLYAQDKGLV